MTPSLYDNELSLLDRVSNGDENAFRLLYEGYRSQVFYFGIKFLKSSAEAEDVLQEVFGKIWMHRKSLGEIVDFSKYVNTLTINHIYNLLHRKAHQQAYLHKELSKLTPDPENAFDVIDLHELEGLIYKAVIELPPQQRKVFELSRVHGMKHDEIAQQLNISKETVKKHIMEALRKVKSYLADKGEIVTTAWIFFFILH